MENEDEAWEVIGVAGIALAYRELAYRRYEGLYSLLDEFRETGEVSLPLSILGLMYITEFVEDDFIAIRAMERANAEPGTVHNLRALSSLRLEPVLHALDRDPRVMLENAKWATEALSRWEEVEAAMEMFREAGALRTLDDMEFNPETQARVDGLHKRISALIGELLVG